MKQTTLAGLVLVLFVIAWASVPADGDAASAQPAPAKGAGEASVDTKPAATQPTTSPAASKDEKDEEIPRALLKAARESFVVVETWYKKDLSEPAGRQERNWRVEQMYEQYVDKKRPEEDVGVVLDDKGHVLIADNPALEDRFLKKLVVRTPAGEKLPAKRVKLLYNAPGILIKVSQADAAKLKPLKFNLLKDAGLDTKLKVANLYKVDDRWRVHVGPMKSSASYSPTKAENVFFGFRGRGYQRGYGGAVSIISDGDGEPVGCSLAPFLDLRQDECLWKGPDLLKAKGVTWEQFTALKKKTRESLTAAVQEVVIKIRRSEQEFPGGPSEYSHSYGGGGAAGKEISAYGVAISDTDILLPLSLDSKTAAMIDKIFIKFSPRLRKPAQFVCAYKGFAAFVVRLEKGKLPAKITPATDDLSRMRPFWVARTRKKQGKKYVDLTTNRIYGKTRGYAGKYHWYAAGELKQGAILVDFASRLAGMYLPERREHEEARSLQRTGRYYGGSRHEVRIFTISELRDALRDPLAHRDPKIKVKTSTQAKRRAWLGVEFVAMHGDLAEQMKVEGPTKDGRIGLLINAVYAASPAEKLGLKVGDILLRIEAPGVPYPIELDKRFAGAGDFGYRLGYRRRWGPYGGGSGATWKQRKNPLTLAMDKIGIAKTIKITYYRMDTEKKGKVTVVNYKIAQAPPDQDSAAKWKNRKLGLTVKDMTYEVRHALNLKAEADGGAPGVVVSKIEPGSPMLIARIFPTEIITRAGDVPLKSARQLRNLIAAAHKAGEKKIRLAVLSLGKTRFADLTISDYDSDDDEGLDEK